MSDLDLVAFRRDMHQHPETGFDLVRAPEKVADILKKAGLTVTENVGGPGIVATLERGDTHNAIGLRADLDALPITEENTFAHCSKNDGKFHGCGHDGHTVMLLGAALALAADADFNRTVHFIFQPDEENGRGAAAMIKDDLFDRFPMRAIYGLHNLPGLPVGHFAIQEGAFCAFEDNFEIKVSGVGGHASMPEAGIDPLVTAAHIVTQLQSIVSRSVSPKDHSVVSITEFITDGARNILPSNVTLRGDCRGFSADVSTKIETRMREIVAGVCAASGATGSVSYSTSFRPLMNDPACTRIAESAASAAGTLLADYGTVGFSEDFAEFLHHKPGAFILMGNGTDGHGGKPLHNPGYDFNDEAVPAGIQYWMEIARLA
jgi:amidohydrolase